jgi:hypothetical protein
MRFEDIKLGKADKGPSSPAGQGSLCRVYFKLDPEPPTGWPELLEEAAQGIDLITPQRSWVEGSYLVAETTPGEIGNVYLRLSAVVDATNHAFRQRNQAALRMQAELDEQITRFNQRLAKRPESSSFRV